ncbi:probable E3 ubiquitin-protein ligase XBOS32 isoform X2 [Benincasa hispida]|uniref:probable E3 ubiquitin-protein ligase XBOS32 isoform X2 n=1 Tax=Benincasa hispida TaxID=102211 RepID=UPI001901ADFA|nr:probable E3 ubiquitin-protein ligase XBOS32 isoform X2 [Benincasa hispida]
MKLLSAVVNSFGCSASGERLVSAARDGDFQEAQALLEYNPRLARYSTFGVRNSPLHYSAAHGHHETALMQACQHGHWEVVLILVLFGANVHKADYLNGGTALHLAATNGHSRCIRLLLADYIPSMPNFREIMSQLTDNEESILEFDHRALSKIINQTADGGITALHMAALNGQVESVQLLLEFGASVSEVTLGDGTIIDLIGAGSTALHYAACGGNAKCCQLLIARGASLTARNENGWTPLMVARTWNKSWLEDILTAEPVDLPRLIPSRYISLPLMSIVQIAREYGWTSKSAPGCQDPCVVCLERKCTVAAEGCGHEFCTRCALYFCSTNYGTTISRGPPGSVSCPLCRNGIVSFVKLPGKAPVKKIARTSLSLSMCQCSHETPSKPTPLTTQLRSLELCRVHYTPLGVSVCCQRLPSINLCWKTPDVCHSLVPRCANRNLQNHLARC